MEGVGMMSRGGLVAESMDSVLCQRVGYHPTFDIVSGIGGDGNSVFLIGNEDGLDTLRPSIEPALGAADAAELLSFVMIQDLDAVQRDDRCPIQNATRRRIAPHPVPDERQRDQDKRCTGKPQDSSMCW